MSERDTLLLLDGHSLAYRAFFALPTTIATTSGQVTNAVYGFTSMLIKLLGEWRTERIAVAFDIGRPTIRLAAYPEYKAGRAETPGEFHGQIDLIEEVLGALSIPVLGIPGHEADDVLATLACRGVEEGFDVVLVTADRDVLQLVGPGIRVLFNRKGVSDYTLYDEAAVQERFGLPPEKLVDFAALKGDPSDNLPSVPGVGEKTAAQLIQSFGSVEGVYEHLDDLPSRIKRLRGALEGAREQVMINKDLARLVDDLELDVDPAQLRMGQWDEAGIRELFSVLQFRALLDRLLDLREAMTPVEAAGDVTVTAGAKAIGGAPQRVGIIAPDDGAGIGVASSEQASTWVGDPAEARALLEDATVEKVCHDAKALRVRLARAGISLAGVAFDTQIAAYLLDPAPGKYDLAGVSMRYLRRELPQARASEGDGQLALTVDDTGVAEAACAAAAALLPLAEKLSEEIDRVEMRRLYDEVELPLEQVLARMELTGVAIDTEMLNRQSTEMGKRIAELETEIYELAGGPFNLNSPPQLRVMLYERLGMKPSRRTKTGYSTDAAALESLRGEHPIVDLLLEYRELSKLRSTYLDALPKLVDPADGRVHATFNQTASATGRISAQNPNLQNIPVRTELGKKIRRAFIAGFADHTLLVADYSQIELRVLAHITGDPGLTEAFERDEDVHAATAARVFGFAVDEVPKDLRERAKAINFGLAYGMNRFGLAQRLGIAPDEAQAFIDGYFASFPKVAEFMVQVVKDAYTDGFTTTLLGRRRYLPELEHRNPQVRGLGERQALNAPIQGSAADIIKLAMLKVDEGLSRGGLDARMVLTVHDELVFEVPTGQIRATTERVRSLMEQAYPLAVPLKVDVSAGDSWADAKG
ncbi:MAG TPA: DNA polymerase I [Actinomycetota bacterium]